MIGRDRGATGVGRSPLQTTVTLSTLKPFVLYFPDRAMKLVSLVAAMLAGGVCIFAGVPQRSLIPARPHKILDAKVRTPVTFEPNRGQAPSDVRWLSRTPG